MQLVQPNIRFVRTFCEAGLGLWDGLTKRLYFSEIKRGEVMKPILGKESCCLGVEISYIASCTRREEETHLAEQRKE